MRKLILSFIAILSVALFSNCSETTSPSKEEAMWKVEIFHGDLLTNTSYFDGDTKLSASEKYYYNNWGLGEAPYYVLSSFDYRDYNLGTFFANLPFSIISKSFDNLGSCLSSKTFIPLIEDTIEVKFSYSSEGYLDNFTTHLKGALAEKVVFDHTGGKLNSRINTVESDDYFYVYEDGAITKNLDTMIGYYKYENKYLTEAYGKNQKLKVKYEDNYNKITATIDLFDDYPTVYISENGLLKKMITNSSEEVVEADFIYDNTGKLTSIKFYDPEQAEITFKYTKLR